MYYTTYTLVENTVRLSSSRRLFVLAFVEIKWLVSAWCSSTLLDTSGPVVTLIVVVIVMFVTKPIYTVAMTTQMKCKNIVDFWN